MKTSLFISLALLATMASAIKLAPIRDDGANERFLQAARIVVPIADKIPTAPASPAAPLPKSALQLVAQKSDSFIENILPSQVPKQTDVVRLAAYVFTDKVIYRPNDVMFIDVLVLNAFSKVPVGMESKDQY